MRTKLAVVSLFSLFVAAVLLAPVFAQAAEEKKLAGPKVGGYIQAWYVLDDSDNLTVDNTFRVRRARLGISGDATPLVSYGLMAEFAGSSAALLDAVIILKFDPMATVKVGQFKYKFTREGFESSADRPFIFRMNSVERVAVDLGDSEGGSFRDIGIELGGKTKSPIGIEYAIAVFNGNGINKTDNNNNKDIVGRLIITPAPGLEIGASVLSGKEGTTVKRDQTAWGLDLNWHRGPIRVRAEYVKGDFDSATVGAADIEPEGWYVLAGYKVLPNLELLAAYDVADLDSNQPNREIKTFTIGATYEFKKRTRLMVNYLFRDADSAVTGTMNFATNVSRVGTTAGTGGISGGQIGDIFAVQLQVAW